MISKKILFTDSDRRTLHELLLKRSFQFGDFLLSSGKKSTYYFDGKQVTLHPEGAFLVARAIMDIIRAKKIQAIGGPTIGADPMVGALAVLCAVEKLSINNFFLVRKDAKGHGKKRRIEGPQLKAGEKIVLIDDVLTSGASLYNAVEATREIQCDIAGAVVLVDRCEGGTQFLEEKGVPVMAVFNITDFPV